MTEPPLNPLRAGIRLGPTAEPCVVIIFGGTGDLTRRKLLPALFRLAQQRLIPAEFAILGTSRHPMSDEEYLGKETVQNLMVFRFATASSSRYGITSTSITFRSQMRKLSE